MRYKKYIKKFYDLIHKARYKKYIRKFYNLIHRMNEAGLIDKPDKYIAINKVELAIHELAQAFEREIE